ncbi:MAG TPA: serine/threonine protein phosphatase, partial [Rectinemataceae bacterium]|nr:serine/threonine protein phosphatase [Rectinemataceae bacterium]
CGADLRRGTPLGSESLRAALDAFRPLLWVCGHIHESPSAQVVGGTLVVNPGPLNEGRFARILVDRQSGAWSAKAELVS